MSTRRALYMTPGDDETRVFKYLDPAGLTVNLTGYTASFSAVVGATTVTVAGSVDGLNGKVNVTLSDAQTTSLGTVGEHGSYKLKITSPGGFDTTIALGPLSLIKD